MKKTITTTKKELLTVNRNILRGLHAQFGFDFEGLYYLEKIVGTFTARTAIPENIREHSSEYTIVLLISDRRHSCRVANQLKTVVYSLGVFDVKRVHSDFKNGIDNFYAKKDFEECRKDNNTITYVIAQHNRNVKSAAAKNISVPSVTVGMRYKVNRDNTFYSSNSVGVSYIRACTCRGLHDNKLYNMINQSATTCDFDYFFDKSGYYVYGYRNALLWRAYNAKTAREKEIYIATDNSGIIAKLRNCFTVKKAAFMDAFDRATTAAEFKKVEQSLSYYRGYVCTLSDFEDLERRENEKWYATQKDFERKAHEIFADLEKINF